MDIYLLWVQYASGISATGRSLVQRSPTNSVLCHCDHIST